ncbi:hypothetical protein M758_11G069200 [Ceratodon purpureus]|nr:hypothetical protein M758_11G069200 [Ceratodon purpureus]
MAKGGSSGEHYQPQASWMERKPRIRKPPAKVSTTTWRRRTPRHTPRKNVLSMSSDNVECSPPEAMMVSKGEDPLMVMASSTGYSTDTFERDEEQFMKDLDRPKTPRKVMNTKPVAHENGSAGARGATFVFQKRLARIDWRTVHTIDVDRVIREVDIDTLETVLDTIAFGDIQGEDTRNFTEANFVKIFRLAQLMVEYLLHVQELLADHKAELLQAGATMQQKSEKIRSRFLWQRNSLLQTRHELKQAKKTLKTYEVMLKIQGKSQSSQINQPQVRHCPFCEKVFESSYYLDLHVARRHQKTQEASEDKILAVVSKAEEATAARVKAETSLALQTEIQQLREKYQEDLQRAETTSNTQVRSLQADLKQSNNQLHDVQTRLEILQAQIISASPSRLYDLESKFTGLEHQVKTLGQENSRLLKELNLAYAEVSDLQSAKRQKVFALENQVDDLRKENQHLKRTMSKVEEEPIALSLFKERRGPSPRERWTREPDKDQALLALARPTAGRRRTEAVSAHNNEEPSEQESSPDSEHYRHSTSPVKRASRIVPQEVKYETSPERMRKSAMQRPKSAPAKKGKPRGDESPTTAEEMRAKIEKEMAAVHEEQKRRQKAVERLLAKELEKEKIVEKKRGKRTKGEDARSCKPATQYPHTSKSESPCESEDEVEKRTTSNEDEKVHRIQEIAEVAAMDVGEETPSIPIPEKQKWLTEHPFVPIPTLPHVVAKYPHPETAFEKAHKEIANEFDDQLREELKKFGITSNTNGISDTTYNSISSALEKQRSLRMSQIHGSERKVIEYERGAIVWHTQRAVHDRDIEIIESQFDVASNSGSDHLSDAGATDDSGDESGKSNYNSSRSHQSHQSDESDCESREDCREVEIKSLGGSPQSSENGGSSDDLQETEVQVRKNELVVNRVKLTGPVSSKADGREYSGPKSPLDGRVQYVSRAFSWKQKPAQTAQSNRDFSSREPVRPDAEVVANGRQSTELGEDQVEEELGLGDWESDEDAVPSRGMQRRVKIVDRQLASVLEDSPPRDLSPPKEFMDMHHSKSSMASASYKPTPPPSSPKSSTATVSAENTCRANPQKPIVERPAPPEKDETRGKTEDPVYPFH